MPPGNPTLENGPYLTEGSVLGPHGQTDADFHTKMTCNITLIVTHKNKQAFANIFTFYAPRIRQYILKLGASRSQAEELTQEVFIIVWNKAAHYNPEKSTVSTWLFTIARNKYIDNIRKDRKHRNYPLSYMPEPVDVEQADHAILQQQSEREIRIALNALPPKQYKILFMMYMEGKSQEEISSALNLPLGTVKSRARLAYLKLREKLDGTT